MVFAVAAQLCLVTIRNGRSGAYSRAFPGTRSRSLRGAETKCAGLVRYRLHEPTTSPVRSDKSRLRTADSGSPVVAVMQPAQALLAGHLTIPQRTRSASQCLLFQLEVRPVFVIIRAIIGQKSLQMSLVQRDYVVKQLAAAAADPTLSHSILSGTSNRGAHRCDLQRANCSGSWGLILTIQGHHPSQEECQ